MSTAAGMLGAMQQNPLSKLFHRSEVVKDSVSMLLEKLPPARDHEGDHKISLVVSNGYLYVARLFKPIPNLIHLQSLAESTDGVHKPNGYILKTGK